MSRQPIPIVIPSHLRAGNIKTLEKVLDPDMAIVCVSESQYDEYKDADPNYQYEVHPDDVVGLSSKRQWIYERYGDVFMLDDDLVVAEHYEHGAGDKHCLLNPAETYDIIQRLYENAQDLDVYLFGFSQYADIRTYDPCNPFHITGYVCGGCFGVRAGSQLAWNPAIVGGTDYWISSLNAYYHRKCLVDMRYKITSRGKTFINPGGTAALRTLESEKRDTLLLQQFFGEDIIRIKKRTELSQGKSGAHEWQRTLWMPF